MSMTRDATTHRAHSIEIFRSTVLFEAGDEEQEGYRHRCASPRLAKRFAAELAADRIRVNNLGQLRFRSWDRNGDECWVSVPA